MSKKDTDLAQKIIATHGKAEKIEGGEAWLITVPLIGFRMNAVNTKTEKIADRKADGSVDKDAHVEEVERAAKTTKAQAFDLAAAFLAQELADGNLVLSDSWAKDNLK